MTCVVGWIDKTKKGNVVYVGADSQGSDEFSKVARKDSKLFKVGSFLIGGCDSFRMIQLLHYSNYAGGLKSLDPPRGISLDSWMVTTFIEKCRDIFEKGGFMRIDDNVEEGGLFLVGVNGRLFRVEEDFQIGESREMLDAIGNGETAARAAMLTLKRIKTKMPPRTILKTALEIAAEVNTGVGPPYRILSI